MEKILKTKIIFVPFLIANISLSLGNVCADCCECCNVCWGEKVLEDEEWNKAVLSFSGDFSDNNFFENKYQKFNIFYDSVINKIKNKQFDAIKNLYNQKVSGNSGAVWQGNCRSPSCQQDFYGSGYSCFLCGTERSLHLELPPSQKKHHAIYLRRSSPRNLQFFCKLFFDLSLACSCSNFICRRGMSNFLRFCY